MPTTNFVNGSTTTDAGWFNDVDALVYEGTFPSGIVNLTPDANDGAAIGASGTAWSDVFLASGAVINFDAGNYTMTHSAGALTLSGTLTVSSDIISNTAAATSSFHQFKVNGTSYAYVGVSGLNDGLVLGSTLGDLILRVESNDFRVSTDGGSTSALLITSAGNATLSGSLTVSGNQILGSAAGTLRLTDGARIGADSTNNLLDDASNGAGTATLYIGNASINVTSDERVKQNVREWDGSGLALLNSIKVKAWDKYLSNAPDGGYEGGYVGFTSQDMNRIAPWAVNTQGDTGLPWQARYEFLMGPAVKAIQELARKVKELEARVLQ